MAPDPEADAVAPDAPGPQPPTQPDEAAQPEVQGLDPQKLLRIAGVTREVLEEARRIRPEPGAVDHLRKVHQQISDELKGALPADLWTELDKLTPDIRDGTLEELSLAHSEILGWLEGLFQGTHLALQAQAAQAAQMIRQQMAEAERGELGGGESDQSEPERGPSTGNTTQYL
jgi:hypothetical protein